MTTRKEPRKTRIAIIGGGPAGNTLAILLAGKGVDVAVFDRENRPGLIVGESLVPALIPVFRRLGIEDEVAEISQLKPGATFRFCEGELLLNFRKVEGLAPPYAYNVPRPEFDELLDRAAGRAGVTKLPGKVRLEKGAPGGREVQLDEETLAAVPSWEGEHPDLIVDATGRTRLVSRFLDIPARTGPRRDVAYFAHYTGFEREEPEGQLVISTLQPSGWSWRILLPGRMSVGVVLDRETAARYGATPEERLEAIIDQDADLGAAGRNRKRLTEVPVYTNYQLISGRACGKGWVSVGDACGFVDPMLSSGLFLAMKSAELLAGVIPAEGPPSIDRKLERYQKRVFHMVEAWQEMVNWFYDGSFFAAYRSGRSMAMKHEKWPMAKSIDRHIDRSIAGMMAGAVTDRPYNRNLLQWLINQGNREFDPSRWAIR